nr:immunoglobulin light chain junction region [Macaca mulatta]
CLQHNSYPPTC